MEEKNNLKVCATCAEKHPQACNGCTHRFLSFTLFWKIYKAKRINVLHIPLLYFSVCFKERDGSIYMNSSTKPPFLLQRTDVMFVDYKLLLKKYGSAQLSLLALARLG